MGHQAEVKPEQISLINELKRNYSFSSTIIECPVHVRFGEDTNYKELSLTEERPVCQTEGVLAALG